MLKSKIHRAIVTEARPDYIGSITIDKELLKKAGIYEYEKVLVADVENGSRLWTYTLAGESGSGVICLNGAAARLTELGDHVIIMSFAEMSPEEAETHRPKVVFVDEDNNCNSVERYEIHGEIFEPCIE